MTMTTPSPKKRVKTAAKKLNTDIVAKLKPQEERYSVRDAIVPELELRISPDNRRVWSIRFRFEGRSYRLALGKLPGMDVPKARIAARRELHKLDNGINPAAEKQEKKKAAEMAKVDNIAVLVEEYVGHIKTRKRSWRQDERMLGHVVKAWKGRGVTSITANDVHTLVSRIAKTAPTAANRYRATLHATFEFACTARSGPKLEHNPVARVAAPAPEYAQRVKVKGVPAEERGYAPAEIAKIWHNTEKLDQPTRTQIRTQLLTATRPREIVDARWSEFDLDGRIWTLPPERSKSGRARRIYLIDAVVDELSRLDRIDDTDEVFRFVRGRKILAGKNALVFAKIPPRKKPRHRLRNSALDLMMEAGVTMEHAAMALGHAIPTVSSVTVGYASREFDAFIKGALEALERKVLSLVGAAPAGTVVSMADRVRR